MNHRGKRDCTRLVAWSSCGVVCALLAAAGMYRPLPDVATVFSGAQMFANIGAYDQAYAELLKVVEREPRHKPARLLMASIEFERGDYVSALRDFEAGASVIVEKNDPELMAALRVTVALLRLRTGDINGALRDATGIVEEGYRPAAGYAIRAFSCLGNADDTGFRQELLRAYSVDPSDPVFRLPRDFLAEPFPWTTAFSIDDR